MVVGLQNGMTIDDVASIVGPERTLGAVLGIAANMFTSGVVVRQVPPEGTWRAVVTLDGARRRPSKRPRAARRPRCAEVRDQRDSGFSASASWIALIEARATRC